MRAAAHEDPLRLRGLQLFLEPRPLRFAEDAGSDVRVVAMLMVDGDGDILTATARGFGKRTAASEFPQKGRGTQGVIAIQTSDRNGELVGAIQLTDKHDVMLISNQGTLVRTRCDETPLLGRNTQGVRLIKLAEGEHLVGVERIAEDEGDEESDDGETLQ